MHVVISNPSSSKFMQVKFKETLPASRDFNTPDCTQNERIEPVSGLQFDDGVGTFISFNNGFFRMYEPMHFQKCWHQECVSALKMVDDSEGTTNG
jgi:hypothetical protein